MAEDIKKILHIEVDGQKTIADLRKECTDLKRELDGCAVGSEEAAKKSQELKQKQADLNAAMKGAVTETGKLTKSYNGLSSQMAKLKAAQKNVDLSTRKGRKEYKAYAKEINKLNDQLKKADAQNGVFGRNVGNYANSIKDAFKGMGGVVGGVFGGITSGLKMLVTNPWVAILTGIVMAIKELGNAFKRNDTAMNQAAKTGNKIKAVFTAIQRTFDGIVTKITEADSGIKKFVEKTLDYLAKGINGIVRAAIKAVGWVKGLFGKKNTDEMLAGWESFTEKFTKDAEEAEETLNNITDREDALQKKRIAWTVQNAKDRAAAAELEAKAADRENYTAEQRLKFLEEAAQKRKAIIQREKADVQEQLAILKLKHSLNQSTDADMQEEADLTAQLIDLDAQLSDADKALNNQKKTLAKEGIKEENEALKAQKEALTQNKKSIDQELKNAKQYSMEKYMLTKERLETEKQLEIVAAQMSIKDAEQLAKTLLDIEERYADQSEDIEKNRLLELKEQREKQKQNELAESTMGMDTGSLGYYQKQLEYAQWYYSTLEQLETESDEDFKARQIQAQNEVLNAEKAVINKRIDNYQDLAAGIGSILSTVTGAWEDSINRQIEAGEISEEEGKKQFQGVKALQIAMATINMLSGIATALSGAFTTKSGPWDIALAAIQATTIAAAGGAEIAQIAKTTIGGNGGGTAAGGAGSFVLPKLDDYTPNYTQNITGANDTANLQKTIKDSLGDLTVQAVVVESEVTAKQMTAKKRNAEATW